MVRGKTVFTSICQDPPKGAVVELPEWADLELLDFDSHGKSKFELFWSII